MTAVVLDASAAVEIVARTALGAEISARLPPKPVFWVPDGLFDVEVHAVLRRWELNSIQTPADVAAARLRLDRLRLRRARVASVAERAWALRANITFADACYVALAERLGSDFVTVDRKLVEGPTLPVRALHPKWS